VISRKTVEYLKAAIFLKNLEAENERQAIEKMLDALKGHPQVRDLQMLSEAVFERQQTDPPLLPGGIAFPHARCDMVADVVIVIATCPKPVPFRDMPVRLAVLIGVPKRAASEYLEIVSFLARHLRNQAILDRVVEADALPAFVAAFADL
jgi:mannitol/fructose-specific phosphotransferase system IIA component (Ntr-type)